MIEENKEEINQETIGINKEKLEYLMLSLSSLYTSLMGLEKNIFKSKEEFAISHSVKLALMRATCEFLEITEEEFNNLHADLYQEKKGFIENSIATEKKLYEKRKVNDNSSIN